MRYDARKARCHPCAYWLAGAVYPRMILRAVLFCLLTLVAPMNLAGAESSRYLFGVVPQFEQRKLFSIWRPLLDELEQRTGLHFVLSGSPKIPAFEQRFMRGDFDFAYMNPYHVLKADESQGYIPLVRDGARLLHGVLVVRRDSPVTKVEDLQGQTVAFPAPNALGASLLIRADLPRLFKVQVTPRYVQTHSSVYLHVAQGLVVAGGGVEGTLTAQPAAVREQLRVLYRTRSITPHPVVAHPRVPDEHRERFKAAWLALAQTPQGRALMERIPMSASIGASPDDYLPLQEWGLEELWEEHQEDPEP